MESLGAYADPVNNLHRSVVVLLQASEASSSLGRLAAAEGGGWAADVRSGLYTVMAGRVGQPQRHSALQLAAAVLELVQAHWLLGPVELVSPSASGHFWKNPLYG